MGNSLKVELLALYNIVAGRGYYSRSLSVRCSAASTSSTQIRVYILQTREGSELRDRSEPAGKTPAKRLSHRILETMACWPGYQEDIAYSMWE